MAHYRIGENETPSSLHKQQRTTDCNARRSERAVDGIEILLYHLILAHQPQRSDNALAVFTRSGEGYSVVLPLKKDNEHPHPHPHPHQTSTSTLVVCRESRTNIERPRAWFSHYETNSIDSLASPIILIYKTKYARISRHSLGILKYCNVLRPSRMTSFGEGTRPLPPSHIVSLVDILSSPLDACVHEYYDIDSKIQRFVDESAVLREAASKLVNTSSVRPSEYDQLHARSKVPHPHPHPTRTPIE